MYMSVFHISSIVQQFNMFFNKITNFISGNNIYVLCMGQGSFVRVSQNVINQIIPVKFMRNF